MSCVYWIHLKEHTDITHQGYVGISDGFEARLKSHIKTTAIGKTHFGRAIRLYGWLNLVKEIIHEGTKDECAEMEKNLRPTYHIGWNEAIGGFNTSGLIDYKNINHKGWNYDNKGKKNSFYGKKHSEAFCKKQNQSQARSVITLPTGEIIYGFSALGRHLGVHKRTAKMKAIKGGWKIEDKPIGIIPN